MAYVNKQNLSDFWSNAKRYIAARDADQCDWTSIPVNAPFYQFEAEPRTPVNPVVEFGFTETPPASGEKGPENPSTITGVDSITVTKTGKNLLPTNWVHDTMTARGVTVTRNSDGSIHLKGTVVASAEAYLTFFNNAENGVIPAIMRAGQTLAVSLECSDSNIYGALYDSNSLSAWGTPVMIYHGSPVVHTMQEEVKSAMFRIVAVRGSVLDCDVRVQLEFGSTATAWEPPAETTATVNLGETRYGGTLDVATGKMTATHKLVELNGETYLSGSIFEELADVYTVGFYPDPERLLTLQSNDDCACSCLPTAIAYGGQNYSCIHFAPSAMAIRINIAKTELGLGNGESGDTVRTAVHAWLAQHPGVIIYPIANPQTIDLDPQQLFSALSNSKVNTVFTDTGTISQITYAKPAPTQEDVFRYANWHRTETAGVVTCYPVPESELHPVVNFSFTETPPVEGEKGSDNPSTISGVESVTVGNILNLYSISSGYSSTRSGVTCTVDNNGVITLNGTCTATDSFTTYKNNLPLGKAVFPSDTTLYIKMVELGGTCTLNGTLGVKMQMSCPRTNGTSWYPGVGPTAPESIDSSPIPFHILSNAVIIYSGAVYNNYRIMAQFNIDETVQTVENQIENLYAISLNSTYYGGSIDLSTGLMTVTWYGTKLTSASSFRGPFDIAQSGSNKRYIADLPYGSASYTATNQACSHYNYSHSFDSNIQQVWVSSGGSCYIYDSFATVAELNAFLDSQNTNGTPVVVCYQLATPFTIQLTPQQIKALPALDRHSPRINTLYTDADSIQVSYQKSPIQTELELTDAILALGGGE